MFEHIYALVFYEKTFILWIVKEDQRHDFNIE